MAPARLPDATAVCRYLQCISRLDGRLIVIRQRAVVALHLVLARVRRADYCILDAKS